MVKAFRCSLVTDQLVFRYIFAVTKPSRVATRNGQTGHLPQNFCMHDAIHVLHMKSYFLRLCYLYVNFSRQLCRIRAASYWIKLLNNHYTMFPKTPSTEKESIWGASYEVKPVPPPRGVRWAYSPQTKHQTPPNWKIKCYKSMQNFFLVAALKPSIIYRYHFANTQE